MTKGGFKDEKTHAIFDLYATVTDEGANWFSARLYRLMLHCDEDNLEKLGSVYPLHLEVLRDFRADANACFECIGRTWYD